MQILTAVVGMGTGLLLGLFGSGGTLIAMPTLHFLLHVPARSAIAMAFGIIAMTAAIATFHYWRRGAVDLRVAVLFGLFGIGGAYLGARLGALIPAAIHLTLFATIMYYSAHRLLFSDTRADETSLSSDHPIRIAAYGLGIGTFAGTVGVGGGFLIVPALILLWRLPVKRAVGTSLVAVTANSLAGFAGYVTTVAINYPIMAVFATSAVFGTFAGSALHRYLPEKTVKLALGLFLATIATYIIGKTLI